MATKKQKTQTLDKQVTPAELISLIERLLRIYRRCGSDAYPTACPSCGSGPDEGCCSGVGCPLYHQALTALARALGEVDKDLSELEFLESLTN